MPNEPKTLDEQIEEMIGDTPVVEEALDEGEETIEEEVTDDSGDDPGETAEEDEVVEEVEEEPESETTEETTGEVSEEGEIEEEGEEESTESEEGEEEETDEVAVFRDQMNKIAEASLKAGIPLPADLLGLEEEETPATPVAVETPVVPVAETPDPTPAVPSDLSYNEFKVLMDGVSYEDFIDNEENFVKGMRDILSRHKDMVAQEFMTRVPLIVQNQVRQVSALQTAVDSFYKKNEDLLAVRPTVGAIANQLTAKNPDWEVSKVMDESAKVTRKLLRMPSPKKSHKGSSQRRTNPSFAKSSSSKRKTVKLKTTKLQSQIDDLL